MEVDKVTDIIPRQIACMPPFKVKVLNLTSPSFISVRPVEFEEAAYKMELELSNYYNSLPAAKGLRTMDSISCRTACVTKWNSKWFRAVVVPRSEEESNLADTVTIRLLDLGKIVTTDVVNLQPLAPLFLSCPALCIICHLHGLHHWTVKKWQEEDIAKIKNLIPEDDQVILLRRGPPEQNLVGGYYSLPVDLTWEEVTRPDPFMPEIVTEYSLTKLIAGKFGIPCLDAEVDDTVEVYEEFVDEMNNGVPVKEFSDVVPLKYSEVFRWLDPELPLENKFSARGTFVDESGQIYIQLHSHRHTVRVLRSLLNEKFNNSVACLEKNLAPLQECAVQWRDGNWYRARFIRYLDSETDQKRGLVVLVDYGNMYLAKLKDIRAEIYADRIPIQSLRLVLAGVEPVGGVWTQQCLDLIQEKINYAKLEGNEKLSVTVVNESRSLPLLVTICEKSTEGVMVDLSTILTMMFPQDVIRSKTSHILPDPLSTLNKSLPWGCMQPGHYKEQNPYLLLCPQNTTDTYDQVTSIPSIDWLQAGVSEGQKLRVEIPDDNIYVYNEAHVIPVVDSTSSYLSSLVYQHYDVSMSIQSVCDKNPPVLQPRPGLPVAARWGEDGWYRGVIVDCNDAAVLIKYVDYGTQAWVFDSMKVMELPKEWVHLPALAIQVQLEIEATETDGDVVASLMKECLLTWEKAMWVVIKRVKDDGKLVGHLVDQDEEIIYRVLEKEGVIKVR